MKKKIGILTYSLALNSGAFLQTYSLFKFLEGKGYSVKVISYLCPSVSALQKPRFSFSTKYFKLLYQYLKFLKSRKTICYTRNVKQGNIRKFDDYFDYVFIGSDQVYNLNLNQFDYTFVGGGGIRVKNSINTYGASFGTYVFQNKIEENLFKKHAANNKYISCREESNNSFFLDNKSQISIVCDPTMLLGRDFWTKYKTKFNPKNKYVFVYYGDQKLCEKAIEYARRFNLLVYFTKSNLCSSKEKNIYRVSDDPDTFVSCIKNAEYIFTSSYHCLLFSIYFLKHMFMVLDNSNFYDRQYNIIKKFDLFDCLDENKIGNWVYNKDFIFKILNDEREKSVKFIEKCLD